MFYTQNKLRSRIQELERFRYRDSIVIKSFQSVENGDIDIAPDIATQFTGELNHGEIWRGRDRYLWLKQKVLIPTTWSDKTVVGVFDFGETGAGNNSGFESLFYVDSKPYQGVDSNHKEVFLPSGIAGNEFELLFRLWSGLEGGGVKRDQEHKFSRAEVAWLDEKMDDLYFNASVIYETIAELNEFSVERVNLQKALNDAFKLIDWSLPGSEKFYQSCYETADYLNAEIDAMEKNSTINVRCIGHTHIDVAWLWRLKHTREKCARSFSTVLRLMERYPEYVFLQTQPQLYEYVKNDYPEIYAKIKERVAEGRWEVDGGMWLEADCNIPSGESLVRQILQGSKFIKEEFGRDVEYLWLPDVFGYSWALPQILKKSGIDTFMTTKISWNQYNRMPHDTFNWKGIDGTEILTHFITTPEPWSQPGSWFYTYNGRLTPKAVKGVWDAYTDKNLSQDLLVSYGFGDGGGGVNREMLEYRRRMDKLPGLPNVETGRAGEYFKKLHENIDNTQEYVHTWDGELYLEYHRGTYTSQAYTKMMNRKLEYLYRETEWLGVLSALNSGEFANYPLKSLETGWKTILRHQFHDIIPGSSITEVYEDTKLEHKEAEDIALEAQKGFFAKALSENKNQWVVVNNANWDRKESVFIQTQAGGKFYAKQCELVSQKCEEGYLVEILVPAFGFENIELRECDSKSESSAFILLNHGIESSEYKILWNSYGQLVSIFDKSSQREVLAPKSKGNVFQVFEDKPMAHEAWDIDIYYQEKVKEISNLISVEVVETGMLRAVVRFNYAYESSTISQDMILYAASRRIDFKTGVDWHEKQQLLKVAFPVDVRTTYATYDVQYGNVRRSNHWNTTWDLAKFETVAHTWVDLSEKNYGVSLLNDCKYGHDIKENVIRLTLIKSAIHPDPIQDQGEHHFTYSLLPHSGDFVDASTHKIAFALNQPLHSINGFIPEAHKKQIIKLSDSNVVIDAIKKSEYSDLVVVRLHDYSGGRQNVTISSDYTIVGWQEANLMEKPLEDFRECSSIELNVKPYEIRTILVKFGK